MASRETWSKSSLSRLIGLKPDLLQAFIDNKGHRSSKTRFEIFCDAMEGGDEDEDEDDIVARNLVQAWVDIAYTSSSEDKSSSGTLPTSGNWENDLRYEGFFHTQLSLAERPNKALSSLNEYRARLGLPPVDSGHPSLVPPTLSEEHSLIIQTWRGSRKSKTKGKPKKKVKPNGKRIPLPTGPPIASKDEPSILKVDQLPEELRESDQETDIWSDFPDEPEHESTKSQPGGDIEMNDEINVLKPKSKVAKKINKEQIDPKPLSASRSSVRLAVNRSLILQKAAASSARPRTHSAHVRKATLPKSRKAQSRTNPRLKRKKTSSVELLPKLGTFTAPLPNPTLATHKSERREIDELGDTPLADCILLHRRVEPSAMDIDHKPPFVGTSSHNQDRDSRDSKLSPVDDKTTLSAPPYENITHTPKALPPIGASPLVGELTPPKIPVSPSNKSGQTAWDDSYLTQHVRIPVWAKSRQELCELPYFKSMQGGVYTRGGTVYGYLLGRFPSPRDAWCHDGRLIVSHGGGKNIMDEGESDPTKARHQLGDDQLESDKSVRALLTSYRMFRPIVILAEADYQHLQKFNLKQGYAQGASYYVLGHYAIVAAWAEREEDMAQGIIHTRWKFAFQYIEGNQGPPWWLQVPGVKINAPKPPSTERIPPASGERRKFGGLVSGNRKRVSEVTTGSFTGTTSVDCNECRTLSPRVYTLGPICLNADCSLFWKLNGIPVSQSVLNFNPDFLALRGLPEQLQKIPYPIVPEYPDWQHRKNGESIFNRHYWAGACCHRCGRVSCRQKWQCWECLTCGLLREESRPQIYATSCLFGPMDCETQGSASFSPHDMKNTSRAVQYDDGKRLVIYYELPDNVGRIVHILNNSKVTRKADELFQQYQQDASSTNMFQRHAMKTHGVKGELYAQHYSHNAGAPYKYIAEAISTPFECCPTSVVEAKDHIQYLCEPALGKDVEFNEVLSIAYAEGQEMNFHSDDEPGLGPVIAGLTLGSHAEMLFRYHVACKKNLTYKNGPFRPSEARANDGLDPNERVLQIILSHGDLLIMDGPEIQKQYEHAVFVRDTDMVRFAATARLIDPRPSAPNTVHDAHPGRTARLGGIYLPFNPTYNFRGNPTPLAISHNRQAEVPQMDKRELYNRSQDLVLVHSNSGHCY